MKKTSINKNEAFMIAAFTAICLLRCGFLGFAYTPYLDDYVQYGLYPTFENPWKTVLTGGLSTVYTRPLASVFDVFFWSRFYRKLSAALVLVTLLHAASAALLYISLKRANVGVTPAVMLLFALTPVNMEGTYWLSAASRIVVSTFFAALCIFALAQGRVFLFAAASLVSMCFYEQTAVFSVVLSAAFCFLIKKRRLAAIPILNFLALILFYRIFGGRADNAMRLKIIGFGAFWSHFGEIFSELGKIFTQILPAIVFRGTWRGAQRIAAGGAFGWLLCLFAGLAAFWYYAKKINAIGQPENTAQTAKNGINCQNSKLDLTDQSNSTNKNGSTNPTNAINQKSSIGQNNQNSRANRAKRANQPNYLQKGQRKNKTDLTDRAAWAAQSAQNRGGEWLRELGLGVVLTLAPIMPFFVIEGVWLNLRNIAPMLFGIALVFDSLISKLLKGGAAAAAALLAFVFCIASVSEVCDYENTARKDFQAVRLVSENVLQYSGSEPINVELNISAPIYFPQNAPFNDHIMSVRGSAWGITGPVKAVSGRKNINVSVQSGGASDSGMETADFNITVDAADGRAEYYKRRHSQKAKNANTGVSDAGREK